MHYPVTICAEAYQVSQPSYVSCPHICDLCARVVHLDHGVAVRAQSIAWHDPASFAVKVSQLLQHRPSLRRSQSRLSLPDKVCHQPGLPLCRRKIRVDRINAAACQDLILAYNWIAGGFQSLETGRACTSGEMLRSRINPGSCLQGEAEHLLWRQSRSVWGDQVKVARRRKARCLATAEQVLNGLVNVSVCYAPQLRCGQPAAVFYRVSACFALNYRSKSLRAAARRGYQYAAPCTVTGTASVHGPYQPVEALYNRSGAGDLKSSRIKGLLLHRAAIKVYVVGDARRVQLEEHHLQRLPIVAVSVLSAAAVENDAAPINFGTGV